MARTTGLVCSLILTGCPGMLLSSLLIADEAFENATSTEIPSKNVDLLNQDAETLCNAPTIEGEPWYLHAEEVRVIGEDGEGDPYWLPAPCDFAEAPHLRWYDRSHHLVSQGLCNSARWFDGFFGNPDDDARQHAGAYIRVVSAGRFQDNSDHGHDLSYSMRLDLPELSRRLSLVLASEVENLADESGPFAEEAQPFRAGLRWAARRTDNMDLDGDVGLSSEFLLYLRMRFRHFQNLGENWQQRVTETVTWQDGSGYRSSTELQWHRPLTEQSLVRFRSQATWNEENFFQQGWSGSQSVQLSARLTQRSAVALTGTVQGVTRPTKQIESYGTSIRYRQNIWRPWFYYELEPFVSWPRENDFEPVHGIWLRLETRFGLYD